MPGYILQANCPCGFTDIVRVGATGFFGGRDSKLLVAAYDPEKSSLVSIDAEEAKSRSLTVFEDPYAYDPIKLVVEKDLSAAPKGDSATYVCPMCKENALRFYKIGHWD